jgi:predicted ATPase
LPAGGPYESLYFVLFWDSNHRHTLMTGSERFFVITGGPGAGKTTLLQELQKRKFHCQPEVAREIIREQSEKNGEALPWKNRELYLDMMLDRSLTSYQRASKMDDSIIFFDRGIPDCLTYAEIIGQPISGSMHFSALNFRYNQKVFFLPPWPEIYETDSERKQTWEEAVDTAAKNAAMYRRYQYMLIDVPFDSPEKRADFLLESIYASD